MNGARGPDGAVCHGFPRNIPQTKVGFWGDPEHPNEFFECGPGACQAEYVCSEAHEGRMCGTPVEGYFTVGELWYIKCPADAWRGLFTLVRPTRCLWFLLRGVRGFERTLESGQH